MATATRARRRKKTAVPTLGKEAWQVIGPDGRVLYETPYGAEVALIHAQHKAFNDFEDEATLTVQLQPLFGEADTFYRVERDEDGVVFTYRQ